MYDNASGICNMYLENYFDQYVALSGNKQPKFVNKYDPVNLFLATY